MITLNTQTNEDTVYQYHETLQKMMSYHFDNVKTHNLSRIKEIMKRIHFATINTTFQNAQNLGDVYYQISKQVDVKKNMTLDYTIDVRQTGASFGLFYLKTDRNKEKKIVFEPSKFNNYARFIIDLVSEKIQYSKELNNFIIVHKNYYEILDNANFLAEYPVHQAHVIDDFLNVFRQVYETNDIKHIKKYKIYRYTIAGNDWLYDCENNVMIKRAIKDDELYFLKYDVAHDELDFETPAEFLNMVAKTDESLNNASLLHAYVMKRKMKLIPAEKWFVLKDFGRSGKGLLTKTFEKVFKVAKLDFDNLTSKSFARENEWLNLLGADVAHANETGEITQEHMRILRKIATAEKFTGRGIGNNTIQFESTATLILDTNEYVDIGEITANKTRTIMISFKDRDKDETDKERYDVFRKYWEFIQPNDEVSESACVSFLIHSLEYLKANDNFFDFQRVTLMNISSSSELTETQQILLQTIQAQGFIFASDETLKRAIANDYTSMRNKDAKEDIRKIGVSLNHAQRFDGEVKKVHRIGDTKVFEQAFELLEELHS